MDLIADGTQITYIKEDSGQIIPGKIWLVPGEVLTVGKNVPAKFATRLVEDNVCGILPAAKEKESGSEEPPLQNALPPEPADALREPLQAEQPSDAQKAPEQAVSGKEQAGAEAGN